MALEFMTGAAAFALINLLFFIVVAFLSYRFVRRVMDYLQDESKDKRFKVGFDEIGLLIVGVLVIFFGSVTQPKLTIDTPQNRELIEYQEQSPEIVIETPPPRTEKLKGFEPLK